MKEIYDSWRQFASDPDMDRLAQTRAREFFTAEGLGGSWLEKAVRQVVELVGHGVDIDEAIRSVDEGLWNQLKNGNQNFIQTVRLNH